LRSRTVPALAGLEHLITDAIDANVDEFPPATATCSLRCSAIRRPPGIVTDEGAGQTKASGAPDEWSHVGPRPGPRSTLSLHGPDYRRVAITPATSAARRAAVERRGTHPALAAGRDVRRTGGYVRPASVWRAIDNHGSDRLARCRLFAQAP
jgi:hypothetical protein